MSTIGNAVGIAATAAAPWILNYVGEMFIICGAIVIEALRLFLFGTIK